MSHEDEEVEAVAIMFLGDEEVEDAAIMFHADEVEEDVAIMSHADEAEEEEVITLPVVAVIMLLDQIMVDTSRLVQSTLHLVTILLVQQIMHQEDIDRLVQSILHLVTILLVQLVAHPRIRFDKPPVLSFGARMNQ